MQAPETPRAVRVEQLLAMGAALVDALGQHTADSMAKAAEVSTRSAERGTSLMDICEQLVPSLKVHVPRRGLMAWWFRFTGEQLESELMVEAHRQAVQALIEQGQEQRAQLDVAMRDVLSERKALSVLSPVIDEDIAVGQALLADKSALARAGLQDLDVARLHRRLGNLETLRTSLGLTLAQLDLAGRHAQAAGDRFDEVHALLLPIWKQRLQAHHVGQGIPGPSSGP